MIASAIKTKARILKLTVPAQQPQPDPAVEVRPRALRDWVEGLPYLTPELAARQVQEQLQRLNRQPLPAGQRLDLLDLLAGAYWRLFDALLETPEASARSSEVQAAFKTLQRCCQDLAFGYKIAVQDNPGKDRLFGAAKVRQRALLLAIQYLGQQLKHRYADYRRPQASLWAEIDQVYRHARQEGCHQSALPGQRGEPASIEQAFLEVVLLKVGDPFRLPAGSLWEVWRYLRQHASLARLVPWQESDQGTRPYLPATNPQASGYRHGLGLDLRALRQTVRNDLDRLQKGCEPVELGMSERVRANTAGQILERLLQGWQQAVDRKAERKPLQANAELVLGLEAAFCYLNRGLAFDRHAYQAPGDDQDEEIDLGRQVSQWDPAREAVYPNVPCRVLDRSAGGIGLQCAGSLEEAPRVGQLIAVRSHARGSGEPGIWFAASLRWLRSEDHGFQLGVQYLAREPVPMAVRIYHPGRGGAEYHPALRTDLRQAEREWHTLITPPGLFAPGRHLELVQGGRREQVRCVKLLESGSGYERFQFEPL
jgi:cyclic-di-GMP-binding protein